MIYLYMFIIALVFSMITEKYRYKNNNIKLSISINNTIHSIFLILTFLPFYLVAAFRVNVGTDYLVYSKLQIPAVLNNGINDVEFLYKIVIKFGNSLGSYQWIFAVTHLIMIYFVALAISRQSISYPWSIIAFMGSGFFNYSLNIMRQSIAMAIILFAFQYIEKDKKKYFLYVIIAILFHKMAIVFLIIPLVIRIKLNFKFFASLFTIVIVFKELIRNILMLITKKLDFYSHYFGGILDRRELGWSFLIMNLVIIFIFYYSNSKLEDPLKKVIGNRYILFQAISVYIVALSDILPNYERIMYMFMVFQILSVPFFIKNVPNKLIKKLLSILLIVVYLGLFYRLFIVSNIGETFPYNSIYRQ